MRPAHVLTVAAVALSLAACATPKVVQNLASTQAGVLNSYRTSLQSVADQQARLNEDNERRLRNLGELRTRNEAYIAQRLTGRRRQARGRNLRHALRPLRRRRRRRQHRYRGPHAPAARASGDL
jgi:hypothetical protein